MATSLENAFAVQRSALWRSEISTKVLERLCAGLCAQDRQRVKLRGADNRQFVLASHVPPSANPTGALPCPSMEYLKEFQKIPNTTGLIFKFRRHATTASTDASCVRYFKM